MTLLNFFIYLVALNMDQLIIMDALTSLHHPLEDETHFVFVFYSHFFTCSVQAENPPMYSL
jgi:hypothetical protein